MMLVFLLCLGSALAAPSHVKTIVLEPQSANAIESSGSASAGASSYGSSGGHHYVPQYTAPSGGGSSSASASASASSNAGGSYGGGSSGSSASGSAGSHSHGASSGTHTASGGVSFSVGTTAQHKGPTFFDRVFNIPISILHSVNDHLNNQGGVRKSVTFSGSVGAGSSVGSTGTASSGTAAASSGAAASSSASSGASNVGYRSGGGVQASASTATIAKRGSFDSIFNIPITALKSVNQLLNG